MIAAPSRGTVTITAECRHCRRAITHTSGGSFPWFHVATGSITCP